MVDIKVCIVCGKELSKYWRVYCSNECAKEGALKRRRDRYQSDPEHRKRDNERSYKYYQDNRKERLEYGYEYRQNNRERENARSCEHYQNNTEEIKKYYQNNRERKNENNRNYRQNNLEKVKEKDRKYYRRVRGLPEDADLHKESSIEIITREWLQENNIEFIEQYYINLKKLGANWTYVDFFIEPNICLYSDGGYYHGPERPDIQERDVRINRALESGGSLNIDGLILLLGIKRLVKGKYGQGYIK